MAFKQKYIITPKYLTLPSKKRSGQLIKQVKFVVAHDTGNPKSTAANNVSYYKSVENKLEASAHLFVDDKEILECIPALTSGKPEKAWHVLYQLPTDNKLYGCNANDAAIGVEYCYGGKINADEAYKKYVWLIAYICYKFNLDPSKSVIGHFVLDPGRKSDPQSGLKASGRSYEQLLKDAVAEYNQCISDDNQSETKNVFITQSGTVITICNLKIRTGAPSLKADWRVVPINTKLEYIGWTDEGENVGNNSRWYKDKDGNYFWSGGVAKI